MTTVLRHIHADRPDVLVLDAGIPRGSVIGSIRELRSGAPNTAIVLTTMTADARLASEAVAAGASGCVLKDSVEGDLPEAIRRAARGESFVAAPLAYGAPAHRQRCDPLSDRELEVMQLIGLGHSNAEVARRRCDALRARALRTEARRAGRASAR